MQAVMMRGVTPLFRRSFQVARVPVVPQQSKVLTPGLRMLSNLTPRTTGTASGASPLARIPVGAPGMGMMMMRRRGFAHRSLPRLGHNLEDHYDMAEFVCKIHSPLSEYVSYCVIIFVLNCVLLPVLHSNYYFTGRMLPKDQGNTQLNDDSW